MKKKTKHVSAYRPVALPSLSQRTAGPQLDKSSRKFRFFSRFGILDIGDRTSCDFEARVAFRFRGKTLRRRIRTIVMTFKILDMDISNVFMLQACSSSFSGVSLKRLFDGVAAHRQRDRLCGSNDVVDVHAAWR
ncbi:hypothetical protein [Geminisphaera colitermitum]|uniref:hypothetical protein n=1 Tax=Geminisphaera colitermitum TaxID=1148786 RepID=UPI0012FF0059|nr:hypothetical protein [Geminisphaera colitermitum]